jgi:hypothetical protein
MATASAVQQPSNLAPARSSTVVLFLRLEGVAVATIAALLYARTGASWWLFAGLWLVPDLSMLGYLLSPCRGARIYNTFHTYVLPALLALTALVLHPRGLLLPIALIWANHIGVDRAMGYGLKYAEGFGWTHLGRRGENRTV